MPEEPEKKTLTEMVRDCVDDWITEQGGGFSGAIIGAVEFVNSDGQACTILIEPLEQPTPRSLGLVAMLEESFRIDARLALTSHLHGDCGCGEDEDG
jgi:hypothetical protein